MELNGLPLHVLVVHAAVVFGPLAALAALAYVGLPRYRDPLRWVTLAVVLVALGSIWLAYVSGQSFYDSERFARAGSELTDRIETHGRLAGVLRWVVTGFALVTVVAVWQHAREGAGRNALRGLVAVGAVLTLVYTALTGDAGAQSVWGS